MRALEEMLAKWRKNPDAQLTLALCSHLGGAPREDVIREVGTAAETWHRNDRQVMVATGRMYLDAGMYGEAQAALVVAGKLNPNESAPYRYLGEVLLRRGDALRSEKVLARAIQLGRNDAETALWHERATVYVALQKRVGPQAVVDEIARTVPLVNSIPPPALAVDQAQIATMRGAQAAEPGHRLPPPPLRAPSGAQPKPASLPPLSSRPAPVEPFRPSPSSRPPAMPSEPPLAVQSATIPDRSVEVIPFDELPTGVNHSTPQTNPFAQSAGRPDFPRIPPPPAVPHMGPRANPPAAQAAPFQPAAPAPQFSANRPSVPGGGLTPAETVLFQLARTGVYDPQQSTLSAWEAPKRERPRGFWFLVGALVLVVAGGIGAHQYQIRVRARELAEARALEGEIQALLRKVPPYGLKESEQKFKRLFDLDSTSKRAAQLWLQNRMLSALVIDEEPRGIEGAIHRLQVLGLPAEQIALGRIASSMIEGDLASAASAMAKLDATSQGDPMYWLLTGVVLDRAGEMGALQRYRKAIEIDPDLQLAHVLAAQLALLQRVAEGQQVMDAALAKLGNEPSGKALRALRWALGSRATPLPTDATLSEEDRNALPRLLRAIPVATEALAKLGAGNREQGISLLGSAIEAAASPQVCTWLGFAALEAGDANLARSATLRSMRFSAVYAGARVLAARVAVAGSRFDEAKKAIEGLDPNDPEIVVVHAASAYEELDLGTLENVLPELEAANRPSFAALVLAPHIALGRKYPDLEAVKPLVEPSMIYGDVVALDVLLDQGKLPEAEEILKALGERASSPAMAIRRARLLRYQGRVEDSVNSADAALREGASTWRALVEAVYALLAANNSKSARDLVSRYPAVLGTSAEWLKALIDINADNLRRAKATVAGLEVPPAEAPHWQHVLAARALAASGDRRAKAAVAPLLRSFSNNPDVQEAAKAVGLAR